VNVCECEQSPNQAFTFADPLAQQGTGTNAEELTIALSCDRLRDCSLPVSRWAVKQDASGRGTDACEQIRPQLWKNNVFCEKLLDIS
jgi:hypothetical protein